MQLERNPVLQPAESSGGEAGWVIDLTNLVVYESSLDLPELFRAEGKKIVQVTFWSETFARWVALTGRTTGNSQEVGVLEVTPGQIERIGELRKLMPTTPDAAIIARVLGV
jgi:hypothetical protein